MKRDNLQLVEYLNHLLLAIAHINRYTGEIDYIVFLSNEMMQDAVIRNLEIIGEASHNIELHFSEFVANNPDIPLAIAYQMRNALAHGYFKVDLEMVWKTIENDLPLLEHQVNEVLLRLNTHNKH